MPLEMKRAPRAPSNRPSFPAGTVSAEERDASVQAGSRKLGGTYANGRKRTIVRQPGDSDSRSDPTNSSADRAAAAFLAVFLGLALFWLLF